MPRKVKCKICKAETTVNKAFSVTKVSKGGNVNKYYYCNEEEYKDYTNSVDMKKKIINHIKYSTPEYANTYNVGYINIIINQLTEKGIGLEDVYLIMKKNFSNIKTITSKNENYTCKVHEIRDLIIRELDDENECFIYRIFCKETRKSYVGVSASIQERIKQHVSNGIKGYSESCNEYPTHGGLYVDMFRFGLHKFAIDIVDTCKRSVMYKVEKEYIEKYDSWSNGYNMIPYDTRIDGNNTCNLKNRYYKKIDNDVIEFYDSNIKVKYINKNKGDN
ncbi:MAG: GIY-YIG nuclease family protein [Paraclostridium sp.]